MEVDLSEYKSENQEIKENFYYCVLHLSLTFGKSFVLKIENLPRFYNRIYMERKSTDSNFLR